MKTCVACGETKPVDMFIQKKNKCRACYNEYMASYMLARYHKRRAWFIEQQGSVCALCGRTDLPFEIDHIERTEKSFNVAQKLNSSSWSSLQDELEKCQLLCTECHGKKTASENEDTPSWNQGKVKVGGVWQIASTESIASWHGTPKMYEKYSCRCSLCREAKKNYRAKLIRYDGSRRC